MESPALTVEALRAAAQAALDPAIWAYLESGAQGAADWERLALRPRILRGVTEPDVATRVLGQPAAMPILLAPTGRATRFHPDGELASVTAAAKAGTIGLLASSVAASADAILRLAPAGANAWQQLYFLADRDAMQAQLDASRAAGCSAIVLTADLLPGGGAAPLPPPPVATWEADAPSKARAAFTGATMDDLAWLCAQSALPVVVKGVLRGDDAALCVEAGAAGIVVSNHGGNQLAGGIPSAMALPEVVDACAGRAEVFVDGGIRSGESVLKALALGARAVLVGRPTAYALAAGGEAAVGEMLAGLAAELKRAMALCGIGAIADIDRAFVTRP